MEEPSGLVRIVRQGAVLGGVAGDKEIAEGFQLALLGSLFLPVFRSAGFCKSTLFFSQLLLALDFVSELPGLVKRLVVLGPLLGGEFPFLALGEVEQLPGLCYESCTFFHQFTNAHFIPPEI
ncbi:MAG: hypothetical protein BWX71_02682 [Deltaproteobacteria bacterium ADurb.Bin072]|nr:MAG: hypothetical protein BWX71_02682 [Deltaproteobacteria bacterium ADurb.Bin072]